MVVVLVTVVVFRRHLFSGHTFPWDFWGKYSASPALVGAAARAGLSYDWTPFAGGGTPLAVDLQVGMYFPVWWLLGLAGIPSTITAITTVQILHLPLAAAGIYALARRRSLPTPYASIAALVFLFFGGFYGNAEHADIFRGFAYLPWILWSLTVTSNPQRRWAILAFPIAMWMAASGAYPGQVVAFLVVGAVYACAELLTKATDRTLRVAYALAFTAGTAVVAAIVYPYVYAETAGLLYRPTPATVEQRAVWALRPVDSFGLYLSSFAWHAEGTIYQWAIGAPVLVGLVGLSRRALRDHLALTLAGAAALLLAILPAWRPTGRLLAALPVLDASRFPAADYKGPAGVVLILFGMLGWQGLMRRPRTAAVVTAGALLLVGLLAAPQHTRVPPTEATALLVAVLASSCALPLLARRATGVALLALGAVVIVDGGRLVASTEHESGTRPWDVRGDFVVARHERDEAARTVADVLATPVARRPARVPPAASLEAAPGGREQDALGYYGLGYRLSDFGGTITKARYRVRTNPGLEALMVQPWTAWAWPCDAQRCSNGEVGLPVMPWPETSSVNTVEYGMDWIRYEVNLATRSLMVENETYFPGWRANDDRIRAVEVGESLRGWVLPAGRYAFTAEYHPAYRPAQALLAGLALFASLGGGRALRRAPVHASAEARSIGDAGAP